jgi:putative transposase
LVGVGVATLYYKARRREDLELVRQIREIAKTYKRYGYRRAWALVKRKKKVNLKKVYRLWKKEGLSLRRKQGRRRLRKGGQVPLRALYPNHVWTYDFMQDSTADGRKLKILTVIDEFTREALAIRIDRRMPALPVLKILSELIAAHGAPRFLRSDNGPEFIARIVQGWVRGRGVQTHYIDPGSPWQNAFGESFNDKVRHECLNMEVFYSLEEAQIVVEEWRRHYNEERPHSSLGYQTPSEFKAAWKGALSASSLSPAPGSLRSPRVRAGEREESMGALKDS